MSARVPDLLVEQLVAGELSPADAARIEERLQKEPGGLARLDQLRASNAAILAEHPPAQIVPELHRRARLPVPAPSRAARLLWLPAPLVVAGAILFMVRGPGIEQVVEEQHSARERAAATPATDIRTKGGGPSLRVLRRQAGGDVPLAAGTKASAGDTLLLGVDPSGAPHVVLVSIDGAEAATLHFPAEADGSSAALPRPFLVDGAYVLDDAPGFERFLLVTAAVPIDVPTVMGAARALAASPDARTAPLALAAGHEQVSILLEK